MSKFVLLLVVASLVACIYADGDLPGELDGFGMRNPLKMPNQEEVINRIKNMKVPENGHAIGQAETYSHESKTVNGKPVMDKTSGENVLNNDGDVTDQKYES